MLSHELVRLPSSASSRSPLTAHMSSSAVSSQSESDPVLLSLGDALLRSSDLELLRGPHWLNDRVISFYFEYLHHVQFSQATKIAFVSPEVSHFVRLGHSSYEELCVFFEPLELHLKEVLLLPVNDADHNETGSHWSLLIFSSQPLAFFHFDSASPANQTQARQLATRVHAFLVRKCNKRFPLLFNEISVAKQENGFDCGVHLLAHAEHVARHFLVYGDHSGLNPTLPKVIKKKREAIKKTVEQMISDAQAEKERLSESQKRPKSLP